MVGCVKYGLDCWMMDVEGKCSADAVARGLPACRRAEREKVRAKMADVWGRRREDGARAGRGRQGTGLGHKNLRR
jgi:hypothetical protein